MQRLLCLLLLIISFGSWSQQARVKGHLTDSRGKNAGYVVVKSFFAQPNSTYSDSLGNFVLNFPTSVSDSITIIFSLTGDADSKMDLTIKLNGRREIDLGEIRFGFQMEDQIVVEHLIDNPFEVDKLPTIDVQNIPGGQIARYLVLTTAAVSNNELTSNYNVRGGSYDENLVYVNGFNVYRPFLTRSGQQEGMSFINTALVQDIQFSAGGFNSQYGDKMSSVLDITYKTPDSLRGSALISLLGIESHVEAKINTRTNFIAGARYRSNGYFLNSLPTKGAYNPVFWDAQILVNHAITEKWTWSTLAHFSSNNYRFSPQTQKTDFGTANEAYSFVIYFDGQEQTRFQTMMGGTSLKWDSKRGTNLDFYATVFNTNEREYFDIQGQYFINELETDPTKEEYGDSIAVLGVGTFLNHARNQLNATIYNIYHDGSHEIFKGSLLSDSLKRQSHTLKWGVNFQMDQFTDVLSEWRVIDSAGYSLPQGNDDQITLYETIKGNLSLTSQRYTSYVQLNSLWSKSKRNLPVEIVHRKKTGVGEKTYTTYYDTIHESASKWTLSFGTRSGYTSANNEFYVTPRATVKYMPRVYMVEKDTIVRRNVEYRFSAGLYYQPPFYREFRTFDGSLNLDVKAQKSLHLVAASQFSFNMWERESPFKFTAELYYKYLWDLNTYEIDNVRIRYYANNDAVGYAYGLDMNVHGEFIPGVVSFFKMGLLRTREDVIGDQYTEYYNAAGEKIIVGVSNDQTVVDSAIIYPGYIPRPTDQLFNFGALIQDRMPGYESFSVQVGLQFATPLPYGPPDFQRYKDTLRLRSYFRVDIGMSYDFLYKYREAKAKKNTDVKENFWTRNFEDAIVSFEVFNLLGVNNVLSKQWIQDVSGRYYSIPNYLTQRRFNLKLIVRF